ncbi:hypothetical protein JIN84_05990 [Luteolibacter yonseiensis]|uniref:Carboxypeptidase regulatory-like domain-containing protein n=1 Tax=Luteolibacter yonseiensis TaxID=1144680 RepID=A0A934V9H6_9BACT|nr:hypothetical protein [Luteolibacter yonseiensis]MBK1815153.1 hypothetical protein [Luteolibacter yonseiensis]
MKRILIPMLHLLVIQGPACAGVIKGTIRQVVDGETRMAVGGVSVGIIGPGEGSRLDHMKALGEAHVAKRVAMFDGDGKFSMENVPEGVPLYLSVFMRSGYGKFLTTTLTPGQVLDISQVIPDAKSGGVVCTGKITWPADVPAQGKTIRMIALSGKNNDWVYVDGSLGDGLFKFENVRPGVYRLGVHATSGDGGDRYDEAEITVAEDRKSPLEIVMP